MDRPVRRHGFQTPISKAQPVVWFLVLFSLLIFCSLVAPALHEDRLLQAVSSALYAVLYAAATGCFFYASLVDPGVAKPDEYGPRIKRCYICNKAVREFDHHCPYLNVCIGENNYGAFFMLTCFTMAGFTLQLCLTGYVIAVVYPSGTGAVSLAGLILLSIGTIVPFVGWWAIIILFVFHVYLFLRGQTTYEWIIARRKAKSDREARKEEDRMARQRGIREREQKAEEEARAERAKARKANNKGSNVVPTSGGGNESDAAAAAAAAAQAAEAASTSDVTLEVANRAGQADAEFM